LRYRAENKQTDTQTNSGEDLYPRDCCRRR